MTGILDRFIQSRLPPRSASFRPTSTRDCFALRLAQKLGDGIAAQHYATLCAQHRREYLLTTFDRAVPTSAKPRARRFHDLLAEINPAIPRANRYRSRLAAIRVERRAIAVVIMTEEVIEHEQVRQLSSSAEKAMASALSFVSRILEQFPCTSAVLEPLPTNPHIQRAALASEIVNLLRQRATTVWEVSKRDLFAAFGQPSLRSRKELREIMSVVFPFLNGGYGALYLRDAAALGLYVQIERLFLP